jgi:pimeloyl-ACP methyl ester carboxylesterase
MGFVILLIVALVCLIAAGTVAILWSMRYPPRKTYAVAIARGLATTPAEAGFADYREFTFSFHDHTHTIVWDIAADGPADVAVIITHGFGDSRYGALTWAGLFRNAAGRIILYDLRAHGDSTATHGGYSALERDDLIELVRGLDLPQRVVLFGYSMGAVICISAAGVLPGVAGVIADGAYRKPMEPVIGHLRQQRYPAYPMVWLVDAHLNFWWRGYRPFDRVEQARRLNCPLLLLHGTDDEVCKLASARAIVRAVPDAQLVEFPGGGHLNLAEVDRRRYIEAIEQFVESLEAVAANAETAGTA